MNLRKLFAKINNAIRPVHVEGEHGGIDRLYDEKNAADVGVYYPPSSWSGSKDEGCSAASATSPSGDQLYSKSPA